MENRNNLIKNGVAQLTFALVTLVFFIGVFIFITAARPAWTVPGEANADGVSYRIEGDKIILSWGEKPTGGYSITIDRLEMEGDTLEVTYSLQSPSPGAVVTQALTYPEAAAAIPGGVSPARVKLIKNKGHSSGQSVGLEPLPTVGSLDNLKRLLESAGEYYWDNPRYLRREAEVIDTVAGTGGIQYDKQALNYSGTNVQVAGVDEADVVKTDGSFIYQVNEQNIKIIKAYPVTELRVASTISFNDARFTPRELYVAGNRLVVIGVSYTDSVFRMGESKSPSIYLPTQPLTKVVVYDITDRTKPKKMREVELEGSYLSSRKVHNRLYLVANRWIDKRWVEIGEDTDLRPGYRDSAAGNRRLAVDYSAIRYFPDRIEPNYLLVAGINLDKNEPAVISAYLGAGENIFCSEKNLYVAVSQSQYIPRPLAEGKTIEPEMVVPREVKTTIYRLALNNGYPEYNGKGEVPGTILNQFSMDEHNGYFRIATTTGSIGMIGEETSKNNMYVLDGQMSIIGRLEGIAPGEKIYSTRFMGNRVYMVTFRNVDPLFVIDAQNPRKPVVLGALKIPGYSDYLHPYDDNHIIGFGKDTVEVKLGEGSQSFYTGMKIAMFDITDVTKPRELFKEVIGGRGTESELLHNHKALLFSRQQNLLAFPVTVMKAGKEQVNGIPGQGEFEFQGAYVYRVDLKNGFQLQARITHLTEEDLLKAGNYWYRSVRNVERILYINNALYTLSRERVRVHDLSTFQETGDLWL
ncbi:MAG: protease complex subunit PrcB family protein [Syntrophomonadaceae bacterium]|nr:protease complex subunit PrcB family protein [Syntrophomonadaceae bacterium]